MFHTRDLAEHAARLRRRRRVRRRPRRARAARTTSSSSEFLTMEGKQFSTSRGIVILVGDFLEPLRPRRAALLPHDRGPRDAGHATSPGPSSCAATTTSSSPPGATSSTARSRARTRTSARVPEPGALTDDDSAAARARSRRASTSVGSLIERRASRPRSHEAMRLAALGQPVRQPSRRRGRCSRPTASAPGRSSTSRCAAIDSLKLLLHARSCPSRSQRLHELLGYDGSLAGPLEFRDVAEDGRPEHAVLTGDYAGWVGPLGAERASGRAGAPRAAAAVREARPRAGRRRGARADGGAPPTA